MQQHHMLTALYKQCNRVWVQDNKSFFLTLSTGRYPEFVFVEDAVSYGLCVCAEKCCVPFIGANYCLLMWLYTSLVH